MFLRILTIYCLVRISVEANNVQPKPHKTKHNKELQLLNCTSWRFSVEANNVNPWKIGPSECLPYVKNYLTGKSYLFDLRMVVEQALRYANAVVLRNDGTEAWIFDVDDTLLSNLPYYALHGYGVDVFDQLEFDNWVEEAACPIMEPALLLYKEVVRLGFKVILLTGRSERHRVVTEENLERAGIMNWHKLILRAPSDHGKLAVVYKSEKREEMVNSGYKIMGNCGDQWSDLLGSAMSVRSFKFPNPMYYIP